VPKVRIGTLFVFSGLPASGKTTLASKLAAHLGATYLRVDAILLGIMDETKSPDNPTKCFRAAQLLALENLRLGNSVVSDSVNASTQVRENWQKVAESAEVKFVHVEIVCSNEEEHQARLKTRNTTLKGLQDPTWEEVKNLEYHEWSQNRILLDTSRKSIDASFLELLSVLNI
jgi:predicted kinase